MWESKMTKLERAAVAYRQETCSPVGAADYAFVAGARWALEQMTTKEALRVAVDAHADGLGPLSWVLDAVRKEIES
jgi:hypothetical protein